MTNILRGDNMDVNIIIIKCTKTKNAFGARIQKMKDGDWWRTWAFMIKPKQAKNEGYDNTQVQGNLNATDEYPGCPHCGTNGFVQCGKCKRISCWNGETSLVCPWCGNQMDSIVSATEKFDITSGKF